MKKLANRVDAIKKSTGEIVGYFERTAKNYYLYHEIIPYNKAAEIYITGIIYPRELSRKVKYGSEFSEYQYIEHTMGKYIVCEQFLMSNGEINNEIKLLETNDIEEAKAVARNADNNQKDEIIEIRTDFNHFIDIEDPESYSSYNTIEYK